MNFSNNVEYARGWLKAFFDGEGHVTINTTRVVMTNTEESVILEAEHYLSLLGITSYRLRSYRSREHPSWKDQTTIVISRKDNLTKFIRSVGCTIPYKRQRMAQILWKYHKSRLWRSRYHGPKKPSKEELESLLTQGLTKAQIAEKYGAHPGTISNYFSQYGLNNPYRNEPEPNPEEVRKAYWEEGLGLIKTGERFGYKSTSIRQYMKRHGIPTREQGHKFKFLVP